ncbi:MAG: hypothetical protein PF495_15830 [Spirochaetales bacterium]|jgi:homocitrate synthase NifV|nr:hypothetical protein [Spirochaetales bacterium]
MVQLIDTTLREGEQTPGVVFNIDMKKAIVQHLVAIGIDEIELGIASAKKEDMVQLTDWIHTAFPEQPFSLWSRCRTEDIYSAARLSPSVMALSIPVSDLHLERKLGKDRTWAKKQLASSIALALSCGVAKVAVGFEDATRADLSFVTQLAHVAHNSGAFRLRLADTVGVASPKQMAALLDAIACVGLQRGVHCHNDFGMATANTIASFEYGADWGDVTVMGIGERAGNSRLEEVVSYLTLQKGLAKYDLHSLQRLSRLVAHGAGRTISSARPILGEKLFTCETGLHVQGLMADPQTYEPFAPERIGAKRQILIGAKSGCRAIAATRQRLSLPSLNEMMLAKFTSRVRRVAHDLQRPLADHELVELASMQSIN